jgi:hypothetical protein
VQPQPYRGTSLLQPMRQGDSGGSVVARGAMTGRLGVPMRSWPDESAVGTLLEVSLCPRVE